MSEAVLSKDDKRNDRNEESAILDGNSMPCHYRDLDEYASIEGEYFREEIIVPTTNNYEFSWRKLWAFTGPGFLMSIAYLDPGNIESDLQSGTVAGYKLLWLLVYSTIFGLVVQRLAARLGTVTGYHLAEHCYHRYPRVFRYILWFLVELAIIGSDMQEVIGTAVSFYILSNRKLPLYAGVLITICDTFSFLMIDRYGLRKLEAFFAFLIMTMVVTFGYEFARIEPHIGEIGEGILVPYCAGCGFPALQQAIGIIGCIIMPHNLYLHSALVKSRKIDRSKPSEIKDANRYVFIEAAIALGVSLIINIGVTAVFAAGLYGKTNADIFEMCKNDKSALIDHAAFPNNTDPVQPDLYKAGVFLACRFAGGFPWPLYVWAVGIFAAGQSSTMTGTYTGQFVMEGFLNLHWSKWKRVLLTRTIAILPTLAIILYEDIHDLEGLNTSLNAIMSLLLPFALIPTLTFTSSEKVMGQFRNGFKMIIFTSLLSLVIIGINLYFVQLYIKENFTFTWLTILLMIIFITFYLIIITYLIGCFFSVIGLQYFTRLPFIGQYMIEYDYSESLIINS